MIAALLLETTLKDSLVLIVAQLAVLALRRSAAAVRHAVWAAAIVAVLLIAPLALLLPALPAPMPRPLVAAFETLPNRRAATRAVALPDDQRRTAGTAAAGPGSFSLEGTLLLIWAAGALVLLGSFVVAGVRLSRVVRRSSAVCDEAVLELAESLARKAGVNPEKVRLRWTEAELTPMTWGIRSPVVVLPAACRNWDQERLCQVLVHEIGHIQRWDVLTQGLSSLACALFWFNPLVWAAARRMLVERERACDDLVLRSGAKPSAYANELLQVARGLGARWTASRVSPAMARRSQISDRLLAVLDSDRSRLSASRRVVIATALVSAALVSPLASLAPAEAAGSLGLTAARASLAAANADWLRAFRQRDAASFALRYTKDCLLAGPLAAGSGRQSAMLLYQRLVDVGVADLEIRSDELYPVGGLLCELGRARILNAHGEVVANTRFMTLWKREEGEWRVFRDFAN